MAFRVYGMSYYGAGILNMLIENKGVHEPQEEKAFMEVLEYLPANSTMLELGAYWAFYSLWLMSRLKDSTCYMVEPDDANIEAGKLNFKLNGKKGHFEQALVGESDQSPLTSLKTISVDGFCARARHQAPERPAFRHPGRGSQNAARREADAFRRQRRLCLHFHAFERIA